MRILVTGSRSWTDYETLKHKLFVWGNHRSVVTVVHGDCPHGADKMADQAARKFGWHVERHPAAWELHGRRAGFVRNADMVALGADVCLAFIKSASRGATMCARLAERAGILTVRIEVD